jgi:hypothetical protein
LLAALPTLVAAVADRSPVQPTCVAFIDTRDGLLVYHLRQRVLTELDGYVRTGLSDFDKSVNFQWTARPQSDGAYVEADASHPGRAYFHAGYIARTYDVTLTARVPGAPNPCTASVTIIVDTDFVQYVQGALAQPFAMPDGVSSTTFAPVGQLTVEFTQMTLPLYVSVLATRDVFAGSLSTSDVDAQLGVKLFDPRIYIAASDRTYSQSDLGTINGWGVGVVKLPDLDRPFSLNWYAFYYPTFGSSYGRSLFSYGLGYGALLEGDRAFAQLGIQRDQATDPMNSALRRTTPYLSFGLRL